MSFPSRTDECVPEQSDSRERGHSGRQTAVVVSEGYSRTATPAATRGNTVLVVAGSEISTEESEALIGEILDGQL